MKLDEPEIMDIDSSGGMDVDSTPPPAHPFANVSGGRDQTFDTYMSQRQQPRDLNTIMNSILQDRNRALPSIETDAEDGYVADISSDEDDLANLIYRSRRGPVQLLTPLGLAAPVMCTQFKKGPCKFGQNCRYSHGARGVPKTQPGPARATAQVVPGSPDPMSDRSPTPFLNCPPVPPATGVCQAFRKGYCKFGTSCNFLHTLNLRPQYTPPPTPTRLLSAPALKPATAPPAIPVCKNWADKGFCKFGPACRFRHGVIPSNPPTPKAPFSISTGLPSTSTPSGNAASAPPDRDLCKFFQQGHCRFGDSCKHSHDVFGGMPKPPNQSAPAPNTFTPGPPQSQLGPRESRAPSPEERNDIDNTFDAILAGRPDHQRRSAPRGRPDKRHRVNDNAPRNNGNVRTIFLKPSIMTFSDAL
jgi:hypothetical protein